MALTHAPNHLRNLALHCSAGPRNKSTLAIHSYTFLCGARHDRSRVYVCTPSFSPMPCPAATRHTSLPCVRHSHYMFLWCHLLLYRQAYFLTCAACDRTEPNGTQHEHIIIGRAESNCGFANRSWLSKINSVRISRETTKCRTSLSYTPGNPDHASQAEQAMLCALMFFPAQLLRF